MHFLYKFGLTDLKKIWSVREDDDCHSEGQDAICNFTG